MIAYAYPGYLNWDSGDQLHQARIARIEDWHPPIMAWYWGLIEVFVRGPFGMLVLQTGLFVWGLYATLSLRFSPRISAVAAVALAWFPPVLTPMAPVWKDAQMAGFLIAGFALAMRPTWRHRALGLVLLLLAAAVRDNGAAALPPLCLLIARGMHLRRRSATWGTAIGIFIAIVVLALLANRAVRDKRVFPWYKTVAIHDIAGTICFADPMTDAEVRSLLPDVPLLADGNLQANMCRLYDPRIWFSLSFDTRPMFRVWPDKRERLARRAAWLHLVVEQPHAYLSHRWAVMKEVLGITSADPWEPVCQTFAANQDHLRRIQHDASHSWLQRRLGKWFQETWSKTVFYRPWAYALLSVVFGVYAFLRRDRLVLALIGSGLLYEASLFVGAAAPDFRYSHWMITCCGLAAVLIFGDRLRQGLARPRRVPGRAP